MTDKVDFTNFSRHQNLFNTLRNMGYILLESELQEVVSAVEKDKAESPKEDWAEEYLKRMREDTKAWIRIFKK